MAPVNDDCREKVSSPQSTDRPYPLFNRIAVFVASAGLTAIGTHPVCTRSVELKGRQQPPGTGILITGAGAVAIGIAITGFGILLMAYALFPTHPLWNYKRKTRSSSDNK